MLSTSLFEEHNEELEISPLDELLLQHDIINNVTIDHSQLNFTLPVDNSGSFTPLNLIYQSSASPNNSMQQTEVKSENEVVGRWTHKEHLLFIEGLKLYKKQWRLIADLIGTRSVVQVRTHAQKYFQRLLKSNRSCEIDPDLRQELLQSTKYSFPSSNINAHVNTILPPPPLSSPNSKRKLSLNVKSSVPLGPVESHPKLYKSPEYGHFVFPVMSNTQQRNNSSVSISKQQQDLNKIAFFSNLTEFPQVVSNLPIEPFDFVSDSKDEDSDWLEAAFFIDDNLNQFLEPYRVRNDSVTTTNESTELDGFFSKGSKSCDNLSVISKSYENDTLPILRSNSVSSNVDLDKFINFSLSESTSPVPVSPKSPVTTNILSINNDKEVD